MNKLFLKYNRIGIKIIAYYSPIKTKTISKKNKLNTLYIRRRYFINKESNTYWRIKCKYYLINGIIIRMIIIGQLKYYLSLKLKVNLIKTIRNKLVC